MKQIIMSTGIAAMGQTSLIGTAPQGTRAGAQQRVRVWFRDRRRPGNGFGDGVSIG